MKIERPRLGGPLIFCPCVVRRRGDRFFPGTLFQDRHRRPQAAGEPEQTKNRNETGSGLSLGERLTWLSKRLSR